MLDTVRTTLARLHRKLAAAETVGEIREIHDRAEMLVMQAAVAQDVQMLERAAATSFDAERKLGNLAGADDDLGPNGERCRRRGLLSEAQAEHERARNIATRKRRIGAGGATSEAASMVLVPPSRNGQASWYFEPGGIAVRYLVAIPQQPNDTPEAVKQKLARETIRGHEGDLAHLVGCKG
jgi:hypothetical protein